jgi:hypothetical protein
MSCRIDRTGAVSRALNARFSDLQVPIELRTAAEFPVSAALHEDASWAVAAAAALLLFTDRKFDPQRLLEQIATRPSVTFEQQNELARVFWLAMAIETERVEAPADGHLIAGALLETKSPVVFRRTPDAPYRAAKAEGPGPDGDRPRCVAFRVESTMDSAEWAEASRHPFQAALVPTGVGTPQYALRAPTREFRDDADLMSRITECMSSESSGLAVRYHDLDAANRSYMVALSFRVLRSLYELFRFGSAPRHIQAFCDTQTMCHRLLALQGASPSDVEAVMEKLAKTAALNEIRTWSARLMQYGNGGYLLFVAQELDRHNLPMPPGTQWLFDRSDGAWGGPGVRVAWTAHGSSVRDTAPSAFVRILLDGRWTSKKMSHPELHGLLEGRDVQLWLAAPRTGRFAKARHAILPTEVPPASWDQSNGSASWISVAKAIAFLATEPTASLREFKEWMNTKRGSIPEFRAALDALATEIQRKEPDPLFQTGRDDDDCAFAPSSRLVIVLYGFPEGTSWVL